MRGNNGRDSANQRKKGEKKKDTEKAEKIARRMQYKKKQGKEKILIALLIPLRSILEKKTYICYKKNLLLSIVQRVNKGNQAKIPKPF